MSGIDECLLRAMTPPGARGAALVEWVSGLAPGVIAEAAGGGHEAMAAETAAYAPSTAEHPVFTADRHGPGPAAEEAVVVVVTGTGYHLLRFVEAPYEGGVFLYPPAPAWFQNIGDDPDAALLRRLRVALERL